MPSKKKKSSRPANALPGEGSTDSVRKDIETARDAQLDSPENANEDGLDLVDDLLATLDARDAAAANVSTQEPTSEPSFHPNRTRSGSDKLKDKGKEIKVGVQGILSGINGLSVGTKDAHSNVNAPNSASDSEIRDSINEAPTEKEHHHSSLGSFFKHGKSSNEGESAFGLGSGGKKKLGRQALRKQRKQAETDEIKRQAEEELRANGGQPDLAEIERKGIEEMCKVLNVEMKEITPDGHCLYAAVADQLIHRGKTSKKIDYRDTRKATAEHMRSNRDEFQPFISDSDEFMAGIENKEAGHQGGEKEMANHFLDYCDAIENTGVWGGHAEILALSRAYKTQIHIVQSGSPVLKVGEGEQKGEALMISYHRRMYGLGEHYNSLVKKK